MVWALALAHHWTPRLPELEALLISCGGTAGCTPREATSSLWAFATLGHTPRDLMREVADNGWRFSHQRPRPDLPVRGLEVATTKQLASLAWSLTAAQMVDSKPFAEVWQELERRGPDLVGRSSKSLMQFHQAAVAARLEGGTRFAEVSPRMQHLIDTAQSEWNAKIKPEHTQKESLYEGQVASTLVGLGRFHMVEDRSSGYAVDLSLPEHCVAIEVDGPSHMARTEWDRPLGHTSLKLRHLQGLGWKVLSVPFYEWDELVGPHEKQSYLRERLQALGVQ